MERWPLITTPSPERRWRRLAVSPEFLVDLAKNTEWMTVRVDHNPLPPDARCVAVWPSIEEGAIYLVIESASYAAVEDNSLVPIIDRPPTFARWFGPGVPDEAVSSEGAKA